MSGKNENLCKAASAIHFFRLEHLFSCDQPGCTVMVVEAIDLVNHKKKDHLIMPEGARGLLDQCEACGEVSFGVMINLQFDCV